MYRLSLAVAFVFTGAFGARSWSQAVPCPSWMVESNHFDTNLGNSVASAGDVNGDGYDDVVIGAYLFDGGETDEGRAYLFLGSATGLSTSPAWTVEGNQANAFLGFSVASAGDVDGDGFDDVIVGAHQFGDEETAEGRAYVYMGSASGLATSPAWTGEGEQSTAHYGISVASAGDVDGDGYGDVIVGASRASNGQSFEGRAFVYLGSATGLATSPVWTAENDEASSQFGYSVGGAGDVNGDGHDDVLVGARLHGADNFGRAYLYLGSPTGPAASPAWTATGTQEDEFFGNSVAGAGDVDGDGYDDVLVTAPNFTEGYLEEGRADLYLGSMAGLSPVASWSLLGQGSFQQLSSAGTAGDVDADGYADVLVGGSGYNPNEGTSGKAWVYRGSAVGPTGPALWEGRAANTGVCCVAYGASVATAGDSNGDGYADVIVGAPHFAGFDWEGDEGRAFAYPGPTLECHPATYSGDGINADTIVPEHIHTGSTWSPELTIGHPHGTGGPITLLVRSAAINGPNIVSPLGGRTTEFLIAGTTLARISGSHDGVVGNIPPQLVPNGALLIGLPWAAQYVVVGGGFGDLSQAIYGSICD